MNEETKPGFEIPRDPEGYANWRQTGELAEKKPAEVKESKSAESAPAHQETSESGSVSETDEKPRQEPAARQPKRDTAAERLNELLEDLKRAGLSPAELKSFKREAQQQQAQTPQPKPEQTVKPVESKAPESPKRPKPDDFKTWAEYQTAEETYREDYEKYLDQRTEFNLQQRLSAYQQQQEQQRVQKEMLVRVAEANKRYGAETETTIGATARAIFNDQAIPETVKAMINDSDVIADLLYVMGKTDGGHDLAEFIALSKSNPGAALRKIFTLEQLTKEELGKASKPTSQVQTQQRDATGQYTPAKKVISAAPPPPKELGASSGPPPDEGDAAFNRGDFRAFREAENRKSLSRLGGNRRRG